MPIYEYMCERCGVTSEFLEMPGRKVTLACNDCGSKKLRKTFSAFAAHSKSSSRDSAPRHRSGCGSCRSGSCSHCHH